MMRNLICMTVCWTVLQVGLVQAASTGEPASSEWPTLGRTQDQTHFSPLSEVNDSNVAKLGLAWYTDIPTRDGLLANPLVVEGVAYEIGALSKMWAIDVRTGKLLWEHDSHVKPAGTFLGLWTSRMNRGFSIFQDNLIFGTSDCRLVAVNRKTGNAAWDVQVCPNDGNRVTNVQPEIGNGKIFIGNANADSGLGRGSIDAFDARNGKHLWRFYTVPGDPSLKENQTRSQEVALKTWKGKDAWKKSAGGSTYAGITYDPMLNLVYFGVDGPGPWTAKDRPGDNLFTDSVVAVNADTGEYVWHYQSVPNDTWDFNDCSPIMIADLPIGGAHRRVLLHAPKNGFFYVLDAKSGKLLSADKIANINWASRVDMKTGRPVETPNFRYYLASGKPVMVNPGPMGSHNWHAMSYDPATKLVYIPITDVPVQYTAVDESGTVGGGVTVDYYVGLKDPKVQHRMGRLLAWDPIAKQARWSVDHELPVNGGLLSTAGNLVFQGTGTGDFNAYDARTGKQLWTFKTGSSIQAAPTTVEIDGKQIVLAAVGLGGGAGLAIPRYAANEQSAGPSRLLAFEVGASGSLPPATNAGQARPKPAAPMPDAVLAAKGEQLFTVNACDYCHGTHTDRIGMAPPDLRRMSRQTYDQMPAIVIGGARSSLGMPAFADLKPDELEAIRAYVMLQAWNAYTAEQPKPLSDQSATH